MFDKVDPKQNFPKLEKKILRFWEENKIFEKSVKNRRNEKSYSFFDGPPFATGLPHYGHIVASLIKDVVPRYQTMKGRKVERQWGWDCHGLPIENLIEKENNIKNKLDIEKWGVENFNKACKASVLRYANEWKKFIPRIGRWVDMENDYKTMDWKYIESIWWVFSELYKKSLVYEDYKSMHICPRCETTLSNFEVTLGYKEIKDLSATVKFKLKADQKIGNFTIDDNTYILAWTTTPWTLPGNVALAVKEDIEYAIAKFLNLKTKKKGKFIFANSLLSNENFLKQCILTGDLNNEKRLNETSRLYKYTYELISKKIEGRDLVNLKYEPLFDYYSKKEDLKNKQNGWKIYKADFVSDEEGTGIVHIAPAFGDDDMRIGKEYNLPFIQHVKMNGKFTDEIIDFRDKNGLGCEVKPKRNPKETDEKIVKYLCDNNKLFIKKDYKHSYPHCWRCDTPLLNYAANSWFINVSKIKSKMVENNQKINWVPEYIKHGRFGKWLLEAKDWAVSRNRFWGAPIPIWICEKCGNIEVIKSIDDLRKKTSQKITKLIFMRHGESESNIKGIKAGALDDKNQLTDKGIKEAKKVANEFKKEEIDIIITSPILRAKQSAEIIGKETGIKVIEDDLIREYDFGLWNGRNDDYLRKNSELFRKYEKIRDNEEKYKFAFGGAESAFDVENRVRKFIKKCVSEYSGKNIIAIAHDGINSMIVKILDEFTIDDFFNKGDSLDYLEKNIFYINNGKRLDMHKPYIDDIKINCEDCKGKKKIIGTVFDCWFESGSMPYAEWHYPFENKDKFKESFPADFIAEGLDQTRGWFYALIILSTALFEKPAFKNVIVNGMVLAEDGRKMSKRLKNYPEPNFLIEKYGADSLRYYLLTSPVMKAENLNFSEKGVEEVLKKFALTLWNVYSFFVMNINLNKIKTEEIKRSVNSKNLLDRWIISEFNILIQEVNKQMNNYDLVRASRLFREFIDNLSNWYVRRSRKRFSFDNLNIGDKRDCISAFQTLYYILVEYSKLIAPFMPFLSEEIYRNLTGEESVHLCDYPKTDENLIDNKLSKKMNFARNIVALGLAIRVKNGLKVRQPLQKLEVKIKKLINSNSFFEKTDIKKFGLETKNGLLNLIKDELNIKEIEFVDEIAEKKDWMYEEDGNIKVGLNVEITHKLKLEGFVRELTRNIQIMRKNAKYNRDENVLIVYNYNSNDDVCDGVIKEIFEKHSEYIKKECLADDICFYEKFDDIVSLDLTKELKIENCVLKIGIIKVE